SGIEQAFRVSFEKLHNAAFAGRPDSPEMLCAIDAAKSAGIWQDQPIRGWDVSCDSRIFACEYPQMTVLSGGPGQLVPAHSDNERCRIDDIAGFADFLAHYLMRLAGTISQTTGKASVNG